MQQSKNGTADDNPVYDIEVIIGESRDWKFDIDEKVLMEKLIKYIVVRDGKVFEHGVKVGRTEQINNIAL